MEFVKLNRFNPWLSRLVTRHISSKYEAISLGVDFKMKTQVQVNIEFF